MSRFFHFIWLPPVRRLILVVIIVGLLSWHWSTISAWASDVRDGTVDLFGWGLLLLIAAFVTLVVGAWRWGVPSLIYHWNQWLGGAAFILVIWGILAFPDVGGSFGRGIIGQADFLGALRLVGLVILGIILVAPVVSWRLLTRFFSWVGEKLKKRPPSEEVTYIESTTTK